MNWICVLFGHSGEEYDGGYHICKRCGMHEFWDGDEEYCSNDYPKSGYIHMVAIPYRWAKQEIRNWKYRRELRENDVPF